MRIMLCGLSVLLLLGVYGCSTTQKGAGIGTVAGAGLGAIIGHQSGRAAEGALIGGLGGAATGALIGEKMDKKFCPKCGRRFTSGVKYCPVDGAELKDIEK
ncbi:MAG: glycine zipper domain-containing protein [Candidatus Omnitrophota bacterium]